MNRNNQYEAVISCCNNATTYFAFEADSAALAADHVNTILNDDGILPSFCWDKFPNQIHYIRYKNKRKQNYKYIYSEKPFPKADATPPMSELIKSYFENNILKESNSLLTEALKHASKELTLHLQYSTADSGYVELAKETLANALQGKPITTQQRDALAHIKS